jgi:hypothetical protein
MIGRILPGEPGIRARLRIWKRLSPRLVFGIHFAQLTPFSLDGTSSILRRVQRCTKEILPPYVL